MRTPGQAEGRPCGVCAVGQQGEVSWYQDLLAKLTVEGQLSVVAVPLQVKDQYPGRERGVQLRSRRGRADGSAAERSAAKSTAGATTNLGSLLNLWVTVADFPEHFSHEYSISSI